MIERLELGLLVAPEPPPGVGALLRVLDRWCQPRAADHDTESPAAWLATSPAAPGLDLALEGAAPVAVWVADGFQAGALAALPRPVVAVTDVADAVRDVDDAVVVGGPIDVERYPYVAPFVRGRRRSAGGLPEPLIVSVGTGSGDVDDELSATALALASVAIVVGPRLLEGLAWGAACVTDAESAADAGARDGREVVVADLAGMRGAADALASDPVRASMLSRAGRRLVERRHDRGRTPLLLARRLGLVGSTPTSRIDELLTELWTPPGARVRDRVEDALVGLAVGA